MAKAEKKFDNLGPIGSDIDKVKKQIGELKEFKDEVDPWMIKVEALNRYVNFKYIYSIFFSFSRT